MIDLEQAIRDEFAHQAMEAPDPEPTQRYALSLVADFPVRRMRQWLLPAVAAVLLAIPIATVVAVRVGSQHSVSASSDPSELYGTSWTLERYVTLDPTTGKIVSDSVTPTVSAPTLQFTGKGSFEYVGCNTIVGGVKVGPDRLDFTPATSGAATDCGFLGLSAEIAARSMDLLRAQPLSWRVIDHVLTVSANGRELTFVPARVSTDPQDLYRRNWILSSWVKAGGGIVSYLVTQAPTRRGIGTIRILGATLDFDGHGGYQYQQCGSVGGTVHITPGRLTADPGLSDQVACPSSAAGDPSAQNSMYSVLQQPDLSWQVSNGVLALTAPDGQQLVLDAATS